MKLALSENPQERFCHVEAHKIVSVWCCRFYLDDSLEGFQLIFAFADNANAAVEKSCNSNVDSYNLSQTMPKGTVLIEDLWTYVLENKGTKADLITQYNVSK